MNEARIDTEALSQQIDRIVAKKEELKEILNNIKKENNIMRDYWETKTSESVFNNFEDMYIGLQEQIDNLNKDIEFLRSSIENYKQQEQKANKEIDEKIAL